MDATAFATAYGLSTAAGLRPFLTLALAAIAMHFGFVHPAREFAYLGSAGATWLLAGLAILEFVADKVPLVDHALHAVHFAVKPVVAGLLVGSVVPGAGFDGSGPLPFLSDAAIALGALNALGIHMGVATTRGASTALSAGTLNPLLSLAEDAVAALASVAALALPLAGVAISIAITLAVVGMLRAIWRVNRRVRRV